MYNLTGRELIRLIILEYITLMRDFVFPGVISEKNSEITGYELQRNYKRTPFLRNMRYMQKSAAYFQFFFNIRVQVLSVFPERALHPYSSHDNGNTPEEKLQTPAWEFHLLFLRCRLRKIFPEVHHLFV